MVMCKSNSRLNYHSYYSKGSAISSEERGVNAIKCSTNIGTATLWGRGSTDHTECGYGLWGVITQSFRVYYILLGGKPEYRRGATTL